MDVEKEQESLQTEALIIFDRIADLSNEGVPESELKPLINQANSLVERSTALNSSVKKLRQKRRLFSWVKVLAPIVIFVLAIIAAQYQ